MNPFLFIVGCPRSGTTLLRRMVDAHPQIAITRETHWIPDIARDVRCIDAEARVTAALPDILHAHPKFGTFGVELDELRALAEGAPPYAAFVESLFERYGAGCAKPFVGDKTPGYVRDLPLLHALFPDARFVHLVRDGRDVALSVLGWERKAEQFERRFPIWSESPLVTAALWWRWHVLLGRRDGRALPIGSYYEVRYEELVADPERECRSLMRFLGLEFDDAMLRFHEGRTRNDPGLSAKRAWLPPTQGLREWRREMPPENIEAFEAAAGDALDEFGYERAAPLPSMATRERAATLAAAFTGTPLPEGW